jgi:hypothetical protein
MAGATPAGVSLNVTAGSSVIERRWASTVLNIPYTVDPLLLSTCMTFRLPAAFVRWNRYVPALKVAPGTCTGALNVR